MKVTQHKHKSNISLFENLSVTPSASMAGHSEKSVFVFALMGLARQDNI